MSAWKSVLVERDHFMLWLDGVLLDRDAEGNCVAPDESACQRAMDALDAGETVLFVKNGRLTGTQMRRVGEEYVEEVSG